MGVGGADDVDVEEEEAADHDVVPPLERRADGAEAARVWGEVLSRPGEEQAQYRALVALLCWWRIRKG